MRVFVEYCWHLGLFYIFLVFLPQWTEVWALTNPKLMLPLSFLCFSMLRTMFGGIVYIGLVYGTMVFASRYVRTIMW